MIAFTLAWWAVSGISRDATVTTLPAGEPLMNALPVRTACHKYHAPLSNVPAGLMRVSDKMLPGRAMTPWGIAGPTACVHHDDKRPLASSRSRTTEHDPHKRECDGLDHQILGVDPSQDHRRAEPLPSGAALRKYVADRITADVTIERERALEQHRLAATPVREGKKHCISGAVGDGRCPARRLVRQGVADTMLNGIADGRRRLRRS